MKYQLFTEVIPFYENLISEIKKAEKRISMMYLNFDQGIWSEKIIKILKQKTRENVEVIIMVDKYGEIVDHIGNVFKNKKMISDLKKTKIKFVKFNKNIRNRLHCKMCAIDNNVVFLGGTNIGDYYTEWQDTNLMIKGNFQNTFHNVFDYIKNFNKNKSEKKEFKIKNLEILLNSPPISIDIYNSILKLMESAEKEFYIWTWYFLPDKKFYEQIKLMLKRGVKVNVILSNKTRVFFIDILNRRVLKKLSKHGVNIYRYTSGFTHSKVYWNDKSEIIVGSENFDKYEFKKQFDSCVKFSNKKIAKELKDNFEKNIKKCIKVVV